MKYQAKKTFQGFPSALSDFWLELHLHNDVHHQEKIKGKYKLYITEPLSLLHWELCPVVYQISPAFEMRPARCISSPYTDRRFAQGVPFKEYMYLRFRIGGQSKNVLGLYFDMGADYYSYGLRIYKQTAAGMDHLRTCICSHLHACDAALKKIAENGYKVEGDFYKADHYPEITDGPSKDLLNRRSWHIYKEVPVNKTIYTSALGTEIASGFTDMKELIDILTK